MAEERSDEDLMERAKQGMNDGVIEGWCSECDTECRMEPDATTVYCPECDKVVKADNPLVMLGMI